MKKQRLKHVRKVLNFYKLNFGINAPYSIIIDGTFCKAALETKINISEQLPKYLDSEIKICTTNCCKHECESLGSILYGPLKILQQYPCEDCGHTKPLSGSKCMYSLVRKGHKYIYASQDQLFKTKCRKRPGNPLLHISYNSINIESPTYSSSAVASDILKKKLSPKDYHHAVLEKIKRDEFGEVDVKKRKRKKKITGPNPLSCKTKKKKTEIKIDDSGSVTKKRKRKRKKLNLPKDIKDTALSISNKNENR